MVHENAKWPQFCARSVVTAVRKASAAQSPEIDKSKSQGEKTRERKRLRLRMRIDRSKSDTCVIQCIESFCDSPYPPNLFPRPNCFPSFWRLLQSIKGSGCCFFGCPVTQCIVHTNDAVYKFIHTSPVYFTMPA